VVTSVKKGWQAQSNRSQPRIAGREAFATGNAGGSCLFTESKPA
jgi:hypothetical protein